VLAVNLGGPMMLCRKVLPAMLERQSGAIVNAASVAGLMLTTEALVSEIKEKASPAGGGMPGGMGGMY